MIIQQSWKNKEQDIGIDDWYEQLQEQFYRIGNCVWRGIS